MLYTNDLNLMAHPIRRQVYPSAVATGLDPLFDHFFAIDLEFDLIAAEVFIITGVGDGINVIF